VSVRLLSVTNRCLAQQKARGPLEAKFNGFPEITFTSIATGTFGEWSKSLDDNLLEAVVCKDTWMGKVCALTPIAMYRPVTRYSGHHAQGLGVCVVMSDRRNNYMHVMIHVTT
jgi:hypothetical protein